MEYVVRKAIRMLYWNRWISLLMVGEMALGMSVFVYSANLSASLKAEEMRLGGQEMDMALEISVKNNREVQEEPSLTLRDYGELQEITGGKTFLMSFRLSWRTMRYWVWRKAALIGAQKQKKPWQRE